jgi:hypothetical protein
MTRAQALEAAIRMAQENDERLAVKVASRLLPDKAKLAHFQGRQVRLAHVFGVKGEEGRVFKP